MFYRPLGGTAAAPREAWVPLQEVLLDARGLRGHTFEDITFEHSTSRQPSAPGGYVEIQSAVLQNAPCPPHGCEPRGAITVGASRNVSFLGCRFRHMGGTYALAIGGGSRGVVVRGCSFSDLSGGDPNPNPNPNPNRNPNPNPSHNPSPSPSPSPRQARSSSRASAWTTATRAR